MNNKKQMFLLTGLFVLGIILITTGVTYSLFAYKQTGSTYSTITADSITFHYEEKDGKGAGISITDSLPVADNVAARSAGNGFNFKITSKTTINQEIPYTVTARLGNGSDAIMGEIVDLYLTEVNNGVETPTAIFTDKEHKYSTLNQYEKEKTYTEKVILSTTVPKNTSNFEKNYRLRMWIDQETSFADKGCTVDPDTNDTEEKCTTAGGNWNYKYNDKEFSVTLNVYSTAQEPQPTPEPEPDENEITRIAFANRPLKIFDNNSNSNEEDICALIYVPMYSDYENATLTFGDEPTNIDFEVTTKYNNANVEIIPTDEDRNPLAYSDINIKPTVQRISATNTSKVNLKVFHNKYSYTAEDYRDQYDDYYCIVRLRSKANPEVIYDEIFVYIYIEEWVNGIDSTTGHHIPWSTWFANDGREEYCDGDYNSCD